jgi:hypothetical protein
MSKMPNPKKYEAGVRYFKMFQKMLGERKDSNASSPRSRWGV